MYDITHIKVLCIVFGDCIKLIAEKSDSNIMLVLLLLVACLHNLRTVVWVALELNRRNA